MQRIAFSIIAIVAILFLFTQYSLQEKRKGTNTTQKIALEQTTLPQLDTKKMWGSAAKEMFPDITEPNYIEASQASFLKDEDEVLVLKAGSTTYVYPLSIMSFHHIVNDVIDKEPVAITYCLLADTAISFKRNINGKEIELGILGPLYMGDLVMYDKKTDGYFLQITGQGFNGTYNGKVLPTYKNIARERWGSIKNMNNLRVLGPVKDLQFYTNFYNQRKTATIGVNSITTKGMKVDARLPEFTKGVGLITSKGPVFLRLEEKNLDEEILQKLPEHSLAVQAYWYVWSSLFPRTSIQ